MSTVTLAQSLPVIITALIELLFIIYPAPLVWLINAIKHMVVALVAFV